MRWTVALLCSACLDSHVPADPVPLVRFCDGFYEALCEPLAECGCGEAAYAACLADRDDLCAGFPSAALVASIDGGRLRYDGSAAAALFTRMRERGCESFVSAIDWRVRDLFTVGGVFVGTVEAGAACDVVGFELISECALGGCASGTCQTLVGSGEPCDTLHVCADLEAELTVELGVEGLAMRCADGTCAPRIEIGGTCTLDDECVSSACEGVCVLRAEGESCVFSRECETGYCASVCAPGGAPDGSACDSPYACASHVCFDGVCLPAGCGTY